MTCGRHYTPATITDLQQIAANIEAERRRRYWAEMAQELRTWSDENFTSEFNADGDFLAGLQQGWTWAISFLKVRLDELSPPVVCDNEAE